MAGFEFHGVKVRSDVEFDWDDTFRDHVLSLLGNLSDLYNMEIDVRSDGDIYEMDIDCDIDMFGEGEDELAKNYLLDIFENEEIGLEIVDDDFSVEGYDPE